MKQPAVVGTYRSTTGKSVDQNFGYVAERLYTNADFEDIENGVLVSTLPRAELGAVRPGDIKYQDLNGDGAITSADQMALTGYRLIHRSFMGLVLMSATKGIRLWCSSSRAMAAPIGC